MLLMGFVRAKILRKIAVDSVLGRTNSRKEMEGLVGLAFSILSSFFTESRLTTSRPCSYFWELLSFERKQSDKYHGKIILVLCLSSPVYLHFQRMSVFILKK